MRADAQRRRLVFRPFIFTELSTPDYPAGALPASAKSYASFGGTLIT